MFLFVSDGNVKLEMIVCCRLKPRVMKHEDVDKEILQHEITNVITGPKEPVVVVGISG